MATRRRPENLTAYDFLLRGAQQFYLLTREGLAEALRLTHRALELDPGFAWAASLAGACHMRNVLFGYSLDPQFERQEAIRLSRLALSADHGDDGETLAVAAVISAFMVGDSESGIAMADRAVALNPNSFHTWFNRGWVYKIAGLCEEAIRSFERAKRLSPVDPVLHFGMGTVLIELRRFDEAVVAGRKLARAPPMRQLTAVSHPLSPISDVMLRPVRRRCVSLSSILPLQYLRSSHAGGNQTRSC
jgi:adenylate cyclase